MRLVLCKPPQPSECARWRRFQTLHRTRPRDSTSLQRRSGLFAITLRHHPNFADVLLQFRLRFPHIGSNQVPYGPKLSSDEETHATNLCGHRIRLGTQQVSGDRPAVASTHLISARNIIDL